MKKVEEDFPIDPYPTVTVENDGITTEDIQTAVRKLKTRKSPGINNITNELIKYNMEVSKL